MLLESYRISRSERKRLSDFWNPFHPLMPLRVPLEPQKTFADVDSSDEENLMKVSDESLISILQISLFHIFFFAQFISSPHFLTDFIIFQCQ